MDIVNVQNKDCLCVYIKFLYSYVITKIETWIILVNNSVLDSCLT